MPRKTAAVASAEGDPTASLADEALGWLDVFIEGFGDGDDEDEAPPSHALVPA